MLRATRRQRELASAARAHSPYSDDVKTVGIPRKVDHLGRIVVPVEFRRLLGIHEGDELEVTMDGDTVVMRRVEPACVFCDAPRGLTSVRDRWVCASCAVEVAGSHDGSATGQSRSATS